MSHLQELLETYGFGITRAQITAFREYLAIDTEPFARLFGVQPTTVWRWENYETGPNGFSSKLIWLLAFNTAYFHTQPGQPIPSIWSMLELSATHDPRYRGKSPRTKRPHIWRHKPYLRSQQYLDDLRYHDPFYFDDLHTLLALTTGLSQRHLSAVLGTSVTTVNGWCMRRHQPSSPASKLLYLVAAAPTIAHTNTPVRTVLEWMAKEDQTPEHSKTGKPPFFSTLEPLTEQTTSTL